VIDLAGIYPPIPTPFANDETLALDKLEANLAHWIAQPVAGVVMPGSNSEAAYLSADERLQLWRVCGATLQRMGKHLIAGTGAETTAETISLTQQAAELGAVAALVLPPFFYKAAMTHTVLLEHYVAVADASPIPLLIYNVPAFTGLDIAPQTVLALAEHPHIIGMKDSSANVVKLGAVLAARPDFQVFAGTGSALLPFLSLGAVGSIAALANVAAGPLHRLLAAFQAGDLAEARRLQLALVALNSAITVRFGVSGLKYALDRSGLYGGPLRRPLLPLDAAARAEIDHLLAAVQSL
jgi:4-hydroxy-2-oxoglutarate aldolase